MPITIEELTVPAIGTGTKELIPPLESGDQFGFGLTSIRNRTRT